MIHKLNLLSVLLIFILVGCNDSGSTTKTGAYLGGHFVNPTSEYVILTRDTAVIDSAQISDKDNFALQIKKVQNGLYSFQHGHDSQIVYLSPGDSILVWANTLDFQESLHFSGVGAEKNNFLINLYLQTEKNTDLILDYYEIPPSEFVHLTDSIRAHRFELLAELTKKNDFPEDFVEVAEKMIQFEFNNLRERYTYLINKYHHEFSDDFPASFFDYRKDVSFNETALQSNPAYLRYLENYLINLSMEDCTGDPENNDCFDTNDFNNITKRITLIDSLTDLPLVKNHMFNRLGSTGMVMGKNREELRSILEILQARGLPDKDLGNLVTLGSIQMAFIPGINIGNTPLITSKSESIRAKDIIHKRAIFYIWSINSPAHHKNQHKTIKQLKKKYPEIDFIGINVDIGETSAWKNALYKYGYDLNKEFQLDKFSIQGKEVEAVVFKSYLNKLLFLDANGKVLIGNAYINSPDFESRVLEFLNY